MWYHLPETEELFRCLATHTSRNRCAEIVFTGDACPSAQQADLFADALNVHEATGLTPSQLQARVDELEAALREAMWLAQSTDLVSAEDPLWSHLLKWDCE